MHASMYVCICIFKSELNIFLFFFLQFIKTNFPLGIDQFGGCLCAAEPWILIPLLSFQCLLWQEVLRAEAFLETDLSMCFVALASQLSIPSSVAFPNVADANVVD